jgi:hypothetical protein
LTSFFASLLVAFSVWDFVAFHEPPGIRCRQTGFGGYLAQHFIFPDVGGGLLTISETRFSILAINTCRIGRTR